MADSVEVQSLAEVLKNLETYKEQLKEVEALLEAEPNNEVRRKQGKTNKFFGSPRCFYVSSILP